MPSPGFKRQSLSGQLAATVPSGIVFSRSGNIPSGSYLNIGTVVTSSTGFPIRVDDGELAFVSVENEDVSTFNIQIIEWDGTTETVKATVSVTSARGANFTPSTEINLTSGNSLRAKVSSGSCKNPVLLCYIVGDVPV